MRVDLTATAPAPGPAGQSRTATVPDSGGRARVPRLGFVGVGWIGRNRMEAVVSSGLAEVAAIADSSPEVLRDAAESAPGAVVVDSFERLLRHPLDGIVIATPNALHAEQAIAALDHGLAVFCQKPLGRNAAETRAVVETARRRELLLGVDLSYRHAAAFQAVHRAVAAGEIGEVFAAELVFHNGYGPDKPWFYRRELSGGGCVMDLGVHLADLALWTLGFPQPEAVHSRLFAAGRPLHRGGPVEDYATARIDLAGGCVVQLACSWKLPVGRDAVISASFYGSGGGVSVRNVAGSFYDFVAERFDGTHRTSLVEPPDLWGGRAAVDWARRLAGGECFDPSAEELVRVAELLDRIYEGNGPASGLQADRVPR